MKILGIDWGLKRVGLAFSEGGIAAPLKSVVIRGLEDGVYKILAAIKENNIDLVVVGRPGGEMGAMVEKMVQKMKMFSVQVIEVDETLSTRDAQVMMRNLGIRQKARRDDNSMAAAIILQRFLDEKKR